MTPPPRYPRIPHLLPGRGTRDDIAVDPAEAETLVDRPVVVEEKLDGANVVVWIDRDTIECATRSGPGGRDRARQLGPLRGWLAERGDQIRPLLGSGGALYGEWLLLTHTIAYDALDSPFAGLDLLDAGERFLPVDERNGRLRPAGILPPPEVFRGRLASLDQLEGLIGRSAYGAGMMEGVIVRTLDGTSPRVAKLVRRDLVLLDDDAWRRGRPRNRVRTGPAETR